MGVLNVTPDSFSDGGRHVNVDDAVAAGLRLIEEKADIIDVGPESTRPGSSPVAEADQIARAIPVIEKIRAHDDQIPISIDTRRASVARAALDAGADIVNDVSALRDDESMADLVASRGATVVLMHMRGTPLTMQTNGGGDYDDVLGEIVAFLTARADFAMKAGVDPSRIILDPGIGFGKRPEHNLAIIRHVERFVAIGQPILIGASRKSFIGHVLSRNLSSGAKLNVAVPTAAVGPEDRLAGSIACAVLATQGGASILRVHDVAATVQALQLYTAVKKS